MRHVDAGNQQKNEAAGEQQQHHGSDLRQHEVPERHHLEAETAVRTRELLFEPLGNRDQLGVGLSSPHAGLQPPEHPPVGIAARLAGRRRRRRNPELHLRVGQHRRAGSAHREVEAGRHHPHNHPRCVVDRDGPPHHGGVARETARPEVVAEDSNRFVRGPDVAPEHAAYGRRHPESLEEAGRHHQPDERLGQTVTVEIEQAVAVRGQRVERSAGFGEIPVVRIRDPVGDLARAARLGDHLHQALRCRKVERIQQDRRDDAEHRRPAPDADGHRCDGADGKRRGAGQSSQRVTDVPQEPLDPGAGPDVANLFGHAIDITELQAGGPQRRPRRHPPGQVLLDQHAQIAVELLAELPLDVVAAEDTAQEVPAPGEQRVDDRHLRPPMRCPTPGRWPPRCASSCAPRLPTDAGRPGSARRTSPSGWSPSAPTRPSASPSAQGGAGPGRASRGLTRNAPCVSCSTRRAIPRPWSGPVVSARRISRSRVPRMRSVRDIGVSPGSPIDFRQD